MLYKLVCALCIVAAAGFNAPAVSKVGLSAAPTVRAVRAAPFVVMEEVEDKVKAIIAEQLGVEASSVLPGSSFTEDLGADSLDAVELIMAIEEVRCRRPPQRQPRLSEEDLRCCTRRPAFCSSWLHGGSGRTLSSCSRSLQLLVGRRIVACRTVLLLRQQRMPLADWRRILWPSVGSVVPQPGSARCAPQNDIRVNLRALAARQRRRVPPAALARVWP